MQYIEIVLLGLVAAFLVLRLRAVLGRRTGNEMPPDLSPPVERLPVDLPRPDARPAAPAPLVRGPAPWGKNAAAGIEAIRQADANFDAHNFVRGARAAFEMIVQAFAKGDTAVLRPLLADEVYGNFAAAIEQRKSAQHELETQLIGFETVEIAAAELAGSQARVTVRFVSEQINVTRGPDKMIVEGNPNEVDKITDLWTFARDTKASDPNWLLVATHAQL